MIRDCDRSLVFLRARIFGETQRLWGCSSHVVTSSVIREEVSCCNSLGDQKIASQPNEGVVDTRYYQILPDTIPGTVFCWWFSKKRFAHWHLVPGSHPGQGIMGFWPSSRSWAPRIFHSRIIWDDCGASRFLAARGRKHGRFTVGWTRSSEQGDVAIPSGKLT